MSIDQAEREYAVGCSSSFTRFKSLVPRENKLEYRREARTANGCASAAYCTALTRSSVMSPGSYGAVGRMKLIPRGLPNQLM